MSASLQLVQWALTSLPPTARDDAIMLFLDSIQASIPQAVTKLITKYQRFYPLQYSTSPEYNPSQNTIMWHFQINLAGMELIPVGRSTLHVALRPLKIFSKGYLVVDCNIQSVVNAELIELRAIVFNVNQLIGFVANDLWNKMTMSGSAVTDDPSLPMSISPPPLPSVGRHISVPSMPSFSSAMETSAPSPFSLPTIPPMRASPSALKSSTLSMYAPKMRGEPPAPTTTEDATLPSGDEVSDVPDFPPNVESSGGDGGSSAEVGSLSDVSAPPPATGSPSIKVPPPVVPPSPFSPSPPAAEKPIIGLGDLMSASMPTGDTASPPPSVGVSDRIKIPKIPILKASSTRVPSTNVPKPDDGKKGKKGKS